MFALKYCGFGKEPVKLPAKEPDNRLQPEQGQRGTSHAQTRHGNTIRVPAGL